jgi:hypothetical protein
MSSPIGEFNPGIQKAGDPDKFVAEFGDPSFDLAYGVRDPYAKLAENSIKFMHGNQWSTVESDGRGRTYTRDTRPDQCDEVRIVNNQLPIFKRSIISAMIGSMPVFQGKPAGSEQPDIGAAHIATRILKFREDEDHEDELQEVEIDWLLTTGEVLRRTYWDAAGGQERTPGGDLATEVVGFFSYLKDPFSWQKWPPNWLIEFDARHIDWVKQKYGVTVEAEAVSDKIREIQRLAMGIPGGSRRQLPNLDNHVVVKRMYAPPSDRHPDGQCWIWASGKLLYHHDLQSGQFPYARGQWFPMTTRMYPASMVELLLADQRRLNTLLSQIHEGINREMRHDIATAGADQRVEMEVYDDKSGAKHFKLPMGCDKWEFLKYNPDWQAGKVAYDMMLEGLKEKAGQNRPSLGQTTSAANTLGEIQIAREQDAEGLTWHMAQFIRYQQAIRAQKLVLTHDFVKNWRTIPGTARDPDLQMFLGSELRDTRDVVAVPKPRLTPGMRDQATREIFTELDQILAANPKIMYEPTFQWNLRMRIQSLGLEEMEDDFARVYGSLEELENAVRTIGGKQAETIMLQTEGTNNQLAMGIASQEMQAQAVMGAGQDPNAPGGQPGAAVGQPQGQQSPAMAGVG